MNRRKFLLGMGTVTTGGSAVLGAGAYSQGESQQGVAIETVGDEEAYLRLAYDDEIEFNCETETALLRVTNHLGSPLDEVTFEVVEETEDIGIAGIDAPSSLEIGEAGDISATLTCNGEGGTRQVSFDIGVAGTDLEVTAHRTDEIAITCECRRESAWALQVDDDGTVDPTNNRVEGHATSGPDEGGWYVPYTVGSDAVNAELWAGVDGTDLDSGTLVGDVVIDDDGDVLTVETSMIGSATLHESHLAVRTNSNQLHDADANRDRFDYSSSNAGTDMFDVPVTSISETLSDGDELAIAFHAIVSG